MALGEFGPFKVLLESSRPSASVIEICGWILRVRVARVLGVERGAGQSRGGRFCINRLAARFSESAHIHCPYIHATSQLVLALKPGCCIAYASGKEEVNYGLLMALATTMTVRRPSSRM